MEWLRRAAIPYNIDSFEQRDRYGCHICIPIDSLDRVVGWSMEYFPEEVLIGFDPPPRRRNPDIVEETFGPPSSVFSGIGYILGEPSLLNVGDEFSVEHISEDWLDSTLSVNRGNRGSRFRFLPAQPPKRLRWPEPV